MPALANDINTIPDKLGSAEITLDVAPTEGVFTYEADGDTFGNAPRVLTNTQLTFTATAVLPDSNPLTYRWDFGDGTFGYGNPVTHEYVADPNSVRVVVQVSDNRGKEHYGAQEIYLYKPVYEEYVVSLEPLAYWKLDEQTGTIAEDSSGNNNDGTYEGGPILWNDEPTIPGDRAVDLDGVDDLISTSFDPFVNGGDLTISGWAYRDASADQDVLIASDATTENPVIALQTGGDDVFFDTDESAAGTTGDWAAAWPGNAQWVHWALTFDEAADTAELFIDGASISVDSSVAGTFNASSGNLQIGAKNATPTGFFNGMMAQIAVFDRILTDDEIGKLYSYGL